MKRNLVHRYVSIVHSFFNIAMLKKGASFKKLEGPRVEARYICDIYCNQGLFQDFASEGVNAKFQNSRGGQIQSQGGATPY